MAHSIALSNPDSGANLVILMGVSGSGKSSLAKALADHYGYEYLDGDDFHSQEARDRMAQGKPLTDAMRLPWVIRMREYFRTAAHNHQHSTLAFSGLKRAHRDELRKAGLKTLFLFLHSDRDTIQTRVNKRAGHFMAPSLVDSQFDSLEEPLNEPDVFKIDVHAPFEQVLAQAIGLIDRELHQQVDALLA
ncbi:MAG TPA: gluconokinase [Cellvibrio sp.]|uniref:gluconokinase n=1 Tax=Cellvibrio sp. TaxID=1965322 RepID=UPI000ECB9F81|nr:gluconokinase [Cellvibrio sp.]HCS65757.1 gluconokinase [Cellvibrio sp.]